MNINFPNDENGDVLRGMVDEGDDISKPRNIDFYFAFEIEDEAKCFAEQVRVTTGLPAEVSTYESDQWQVCVTKYMVPKHHDITELETSLTHIARLYHGDADGWGSMKQD